MSDMLEEPGVVVELESEFAIVRTERKNACQSCSVNKGCGTGALSKVIGTRSNLVKAINGIEAQVGDEVIIGLEQQALTSASFAVYILPLIAMLAGALIGQYLVGEIGVEQGDLLIALCGMFGLFVGFLWVRNFSHKNASNPKYQPMLLRICASRGETVIGMPESSGRNC